MKFYLFPVTILTFILFSTTDLNAQTTVYYDFSATTQLPIGPNDPLNLYKLLENNNVWVHNEGESTATDKIYRASAYGPHSQGANANAHSFAFTDDMHIYELTSSGPFRWSGLYEIDEDLNARYSANGKDYLVLTDRLMQGILTIRDITGQ